MTRKSLYQGPFGELSNYHERLGDTSLPRGENIISSMRRLFQSLDVVAAAAATHRQRFGIGALRRILNVTNTLIFAWLCTIWWGERVVFKNSLDACRWHRWEQWVSDAIAFSIRSVLTMLSSGSRHPQDPIILHL